MAGELTGGCLCGAVTFTLTGPFEVSHCYCSRCRKKTGTARATGMLVDPEQVRLDSGTDHVKRWYLPSAKSFGVTVCDVCGCPLPHLTRSGKTMIVPAGSINEDLPVVPSGNYEWDSRANWVRLDETDLPCYGRY